MNEQRNTYDSMARRLQELERKQKEQAEILRRQLQKSREEKLRHG